MPYFGTTEGRSWGDSLETAPSIPNNAVFIVLGMESPEATDGYCCPRELSGNLESAKLEIFLRDFESPGMEKWLDAMPGPWKPGFLEESCCKNKPAAL